MTTIEQLQALEALRVNGTLTEVEFQHEKAKVLGQDIGTSVGEVKRSWWRLNALQWVALSLLLLIGGSVFLQWWSDRGRGRNYNELDYRLSAEEFPMPKPVVTESHWEEGNSTIWDFKRTIVGTIRNKGVDGYVNIVASARQGTKEFERKDRRFLNSEEECTVRYEFDEIESGHGTYTGSISITPSR